MGVALAVTIIFGSVKDAFEYIDALSGQQLSNLRLNTLQVILVTIGVMGFLLLAYDILKSKSRRICWRDGVRCRKCGRLFDLQHQPDKVVFSENLGSVTLPCPYCKYKGTYQRKEWVQNLYDNRQ